MDLEVGKVFKVGNTRSVSIHYILFALTSKVMNFSFLMVTRLLGRFAQWSANNENIYLFLDPVLESYN